VYAAGNELLVGQLNFLLFPRKTSKPMLHVSASVFLLGHKQE
jgi:hypothetical protein